MCSIHVIFVSKVSLCVCVDVNWVIERLPVTHCGRSDALGLRSVNTIFHHHDSKSLRSNVCSQIFDVVHILTNCICVRPPQHIKMQQYGTVHIDRNKTKRARLNLVMMDGFAHEVSNSHLTLWRDQSPQAAPQHFWLLTSSHSSSST